MTGAPLAGAPGRVDAHAHVFAADLPLAPDRRYTPERDALLATYLDLLDRHAVTHGVLIAPSFLGTDNRYLLSALAAAPSRLRATVSVGPGVPPPALEEMARAGVVGIRLNLYRKAELPDLAAPDWRPLLRRIADLDWHVEVYVEGPRLPPLLDAARRAGVKLVVDHFGSPDPREGPRCAGFRALLAAARRGRTWVKLSAPYRLGGDAAPLAAALLAEAGPARLLWGSDWPWTQHDRGLTYAQTLAWLAAWVPEEAQRRAIEWETPAALFRFDR